MPGSQTKLITCLCNIEHPRYHNPKLDDARDQVAEGDISEADLEALDAELAELMPDAVRAQVPSLATVDAEMSSLKITEGTHGQRLASGLASSISPQLR